MLVLTRREGETVKVYKDGEEILSVMVVRSHGGVRLGFEAEKDIQILREELINERDRGVSEGECS